MDCNFVSPGGNKSLQILTTASSCVILLGESTLLFGKVTRRVDDAYEIRHKNTIAYFLIFNWNNNIVLTFLCIEYRAV